MATKKQTVARATRPTTIDNSAFISKAWMERKTLQDAELRGFVHFFYLAICGHIESLLAFKITKRLESIERLHLGKAPIQEIHFNGKTHHCSLEPIINSAKGIAAGLIKDAETAPISKLINLHDRIFTETLVEIIGIELKSDLDALTSLRNLFAHARDIVMDFDDMGPPLLGNLEGNPLLKPAERLYKAKVIKHLKITGMNYGKFQEHFYKDEAMLYFFQAVKSIHEKLASSYSFLPEKYTFPLRMELPEIKS